MTIELRPEEQRIVNDAVRSGEYERPEDVIADALAAWRKQRPCPSEPLDRTGKEPVHVRAKNLVELFAESPFKGLDIEFKRDKDTGREINL